MRTWQYILAGVIGAILGFAFQYITDNGGESRVTLKADIPLQGTFHEGGKPYTLTYRLLGRSLGTPYRTENGNFAYPGVPDNVAREGYAPIEKQAQWKSLWYQLRFLNWLQTKGDTVLRTASIGSVILPFWLFLIFRSGDKQIEKKSIASEFRKQ